VRSVACALAATFAAAGCGGGPHPTPPRPAPPPPRQAPVAEGFHVVQRDGVALWSRRTEDGRHALVIRRVGRPPRPVGVRPSLWPFDADLGEDARGRLVAVYSRCGAHDRQRSGYPGNRESCDLYALDVATGRERRLAALSTRGASERTPALDRGTIEFVRVGEPEQPDFPARLMRARLDGGAPHTIAELPDTTIADDLLGADLDRGRLALAVYRAPALDPAHGEWVVLLGRSDGRGLHVVDTGGAGEEHAERRGSPTFAAGALYWTASNDEPAGPAAEVPNAHVRRRDLRTGATTERAVDGYLISVAADAVRPTAPLLISADDGGNDPSVEWYSRTVVRAIPTRGFR